MGKIALEGLKFYARHGYYAEEQHIGTYVLVDIYLDADIGKAAEHDDISGTVDYEKLYELIREEVNQPSRLIEHAAQRILDRIIKEYVPVRSVKVRLSKLNPPLGGESKRAYVELEKKRE